MIGPRYALHTLRREWRLPELRTLAAALLLSVVVLGAVATLAARMQNAIVLSAADLIGGDLGIDAATPLPAAFAAHAHALGLRTSQLASFPSVAFADGHSQLLDVMAGDAAWPLRGKLTVIDAAGHVSDTHAPATGRVYVDHRALIALGLKVGAPLQIGGMDLRIAGVIQQQPGAGDLIALAPRAVLSLGDAERAGLLGTGSRAKHQLLVAGKPAAITAYRDWVRSHLPANAHLVTPESV